MTIKQCGCNEECRCRIDTSKIKLNDNLYLDISEYKDLINSPLDIIGMEPTEKTLAFIRESNSESLETNLRTEIRKFSKSTINHKICSSCEDNKFISNFKKDSNICNTCRVPKKYHDEFKKNLMESSHIDRDCNFLLSCVEEYVK